MKKLRALVALLCVLAFVAAACGGDDGDDTAADSAAADEAAANLAAAQSEAESAAADAAAAEQELQDALDEAAAGNAEAAAMIEDLEAEVAAAQATAAAAAEEAARASAELDRIIIEEPEEEMMITTGLGVDADEKVIRVGVNTDLSGAFAPLTTKITDGHEVYWEWLNDRGGIQGWTVEPVILDNAYQVPNHLENYEIMSGDGPESVVMFSTSTGSPHTAATAEALVRDQMAAVPLSWYSGWADPEIGQNVFEVQANYCIEAMNGATYMSETYGNKVAIASFPGDYGEDGAEGVKVAAEALALEIVYDGQGAVVPGADQTPVITGIVESGADWVWLTTNPTIMAELLGGAVAAGFTGQWSGNGPSWNPLLLNTGVAELADQYYTHSYYSVLWDVGESQGMQDMIAAMREFRPDAPFDDVYVISWIEGLIATQILDAAITNGDLTRAGVLEAAKTLTVDLQGLAPDQTWSGDPNDNIVRETYLYDVDMSLYTPGVTVLEEGGNNGFTLIKGPYASETALNWTYEPCFKAS